MATLERPIDRGTRLGRRALSDLGRELREARVDRGLSVALAATAAGISNAHLSRIERALAANVPLATLARCAAIVGLDLVVRAYPGGPPVRDAAQLAVLSVLRTTLHRSLRWATEVLVAARGDQRAWDATITGDGWRYGVEAETAPRDAQALMRRLALKLRDGAVDGVLLVLPDTRRSRQFLREARVELESTFRVDGRRALELLGAGADPGGSAVLLLPRTVDTAARPARVTRRV